MSAELTPGQRSLRTGLHDNALSPGTPLLTYDDLATWLSTSVRHLRRLVDEGRIPFHKVGWFVRFDEAEIREWLQDNGSATIDIRGYQKRRARGGR